ncbi:MAG: transketolase [Gemmatimonadetes bacterium]|nr:transketolase [Gemmatimonadota bacterium]
MRRAFSESLVKIGAENPRLMLLTGDLGFQVFDEFEAAYGPRYVNVGVAEAQLVCASAGLALEGWSPVAYSIASFVTGRAFEQIRVSVAYPGLPVAIVGAGGGYTYSASGPTHHAADDLALMSTLPGMTVVAPGDPEEVSQLFPQLIANHGPAYFRVGRFGEPRYDAEEPAVLGKARLLRNGEQIAILTTGDMAAVTLEAVELLKADGILPIVYQYHTVKPLDTKTLNSLAGEVSTIVVAEEQTPIGGLAAGINAWRATWDGPMKIVRVGPPDRFILGNLERAVLRGRHCYDAMAIAKACSEVWNQSPSS